MTDSTLDVERPAVKLRIAAHRLSASSGGVYQHVNPCTGQPDATVPLAGEAEVDRAVHIAHEAYLKWRCTKGSVNGAANLNPTWPFGGIGISGLGKEGGRHGLDEFLRIKGVSIA
jgi:acyl-CoA reductase-like NAD-dependent aldehyde dehydrogenase